MEYFLLKMGGDLDLGTAALHHFSEESVPLSLEALEVGEQNKAGQ